jgi:hypothetical protein
MMRAITFDHEFPDLTIGSVHLPFKPVLIASPHSIAIQMAPLGAGERNGTFALSHDLVAYMYMLIGYERVNLGEVPCWGSFATLK